MISSDDGSISVATAGLGGHVQTLHHLVRVGVVFCFFVRPSVLRAGLPDSVSKILKTGAPCEVRDLTAASP